MKGDNFFEGKIHIENPLASTEKSDKKREASRERNKEEKAISGCKEMTKKISIESDAIISDAKNIEEIKSLTSQCTDLQEWIDIEDPDLQEQIDQIKEQTPGGIEELDMLLGNLSGYPITRELLEQIAAPIKYSKETKEDILEQTIRKFPELQERDDSMKAKEKRLVKRIINTCCSNHNLLKGEKLRSVFNYIDGKKSTDDLIEEGLTHNEVNAIDILITNQDDGIPSNFREYLSEILSTDGDFAQLFQVTVSKKEEREKKLAREGRMGTDIIKDAGYRLEESFFSNKLLAISQYTDTASLRKYQEATSAKEITRQLLQKNPNSILQKIGKQKEDEDVKKDQIEIVKFLRKSDAQTLIQGSKTLENISSIKKKTRLAIGKVLSATTLIGAGALMGIGIQEARIQKTEMNEEYLARELQKAQSLNEQKIEDWKKQPTLSEIEAIEMSHREDVYFMSRTSDESLESLVKELLWESQTTQEDLNNAFIGLDEGIIVGIGKEFRRILKKQRVKYKNNEYTRHDVIHDGNKAKYYIDEQGEKQLVLTTYAYKKGALIRYVRWYDQAIKIDDFQLTKNQKIILTMITKNAEKAYKQKYPETSSSEIKESNDSRYMADEFVKKN